jgi:tetratricopeptide (TPR) repeat protein
MRRMQHTIDEPLSMSIYNTNVSSEQTTSGLDGRFVHSQLLIDCLLRMQPTPTDKNEFISLCLKEYDGNETQLKTIHEFEEEYSSEKSIEWYTRDTFLYRSLNKSLRVQDIGLLFGFRFLIRDIEQQLQKYRCTSLTRLYRGQLISTEELEVLQESKGKLISMNSFFSTSLDRNIALMFLDPSNNDNKLKKVLFEIDADPCRDHVKPFANITSFSYYQEEKEVLMMLGSVFRIDNIHLDQHHIWVVNLTLCSDTDHDLKSVFDHMKNQYGAEQTRLLLFGHVLVDMAHFDDAEDYYHRLLKELPPDHTDLSNCYHALGKVACEKADYDLSLEWLYKSLHILQRKLKTDDPRMGFIHTTIGEVCQRKGDYKQALESYETALQIWTKVHHDQHDSIAWCYNNLGIVYDEQKEYSKALDFHKKSLKIKTKILPPQHPCLGNAYLNIGNVYYHLGEYNQALEYYQLSCNIYRQSLTPEHPSIASAVKNIGIIYEAQNEYSKALQNYRKASIIREKTFSSSHPDSLQIEKDIERVLLKMK